MENSVLLLYSIDPNNFNHYHTQYMKLVAIWLFLYMYTDSCSFVKTFLSSGCKLLYWLTKVINKSIIKLFLNYKLRNLLKY